MSVSGLPGKIRFIVTRWNFTRQRLAASDAGFPASNLYVRAWFALIVDGDLRKRAAGRRCVAFNTSGSCENVIAQAGGLADQLLRDNEAKLSPKSFRRGQVYAGCHEYARSLSAVPGLMTTCIAYITRDLRLSLSHSAGLRQAEWWK